MFVGTEMFSVTTTRLICFLAISIAQSTSVAGRKESEVCASDGMVSASGRNAGVQAASNGYQGPVVVDGIITGIPEVPDTLHPVPADMDKKIKDPWMPHATKAVSMEKPDGADSPDNRTVLQQHVDFWDFDHDGKIYPWDTYTGFHKIGFNPFLSAFAVLVIHGTFSYPSQGRWLPDPLFSVKTRYIHRCKHGSDSEVYDTEGRYIPNKYELIFAKFDKENKGGLYYKDMLQLMARNRNVFDPVGWTAEFLEWSALWLLCADEKGLVSREVIRGQYDGSLFYQLARKNEARKAAKKAAKAMKKH